MACANRGIDRVTILQPGGLPMTYAAVTDGLLIRRGSKGNQVRPNLIQEGKLSEFQEQSEPSSTRDLIFLIMLASNEDTFGQGERVHMV